MKLSDRATLIHPARFLFNAGKTPKDWNNEVLNNPNFRVIRYWANSASVFPSVDIKGGVAITCWDKNKNFGKIGFFSAYNELHKILERVTEKEEISFATIVAPRGLYGITSDLYQENPELEGRQSQGCRFNFGSNIFNVFPELFSDECPQGKDEYAQIYGRYNNRRCFKWIKRKYITQPENFDKYKVIIPEANGSGAIGEVLSTPIVGLPIVGYTDTFIGIGVFDTRDEAEACLKYVKTKFARTMLGTLKATQHNPRGTWAHVPLQDFTTASDIDWSQSVADIDKQLYSKYQLSESEVDFIERMIKAMK